MVSQNFYDPKVLEDKEHILYGKTAKDFKFLKQVPLIKKEEKITIKQCFDYFNSGIESIALIDGNKFNGMIDKASINKLFFLKKLKMDDDARKCKVLEVWRTPIDTDFSTVQKILNVKNYLFLVDKEENGDIKKVL